jgi:hypothetical protein
LAESDVARKLHVYHTLYRLNLSFARVVEHCGALGECGILSPKFTRLYQSYSQELQAEINEEVAGVINEAELRDMHRFGKARIAREKELRDPDDVFLLAEERRKQIARQGGKMPRLARKNTSTSSPLRKSMRTQKARPGREKRAV